MDTERDFIRADEVDIQVTDDSELPSGWEKTHEEYSRPVKDFQGYYIYTYESEHFLVTREVDNRGKEATHHVALLKVKRGDDGEKLTSLGTGVYQDVGVEDGFQFDEIDSIEDHKEAHRTAEKAALQVAVDLMRDVNNGKYDHNKFSEN